MKSPTSSRDFALRITGGSQLAGDLCVSGSKNAVHWLDSAAQHRYDVLQRAFLGRAVWVYGWSADGTKTLALVEAPTSPPVYYLESKPITKQDLQTQLDELFQRAPQTDLVIKADQRLKYADVKEVFKMSKDAGFQDVGLIAEKKLKLAG